MRAHSLVNGFTCMQKTHWNKEQNKCFVLGSVSWNFYIDVLFIKIIMIQNSKECVFVEILMSNQQISISLWPISRCAVPLKAICRPQSHCASVGPVSAASVSVLFGIAQSIPCALVSVCVFVRVCILFSRCSSDKGGWTPQLTITPPFYTHGVSCREDDAEAACEAEITPSESSVKYL